MFYIIYSLHLKFTSFTETKVTDPVKAKMSAFIKIEFV